jgi:hypothetical protein
MAHAPDDIARLHSGTFDTLDLPRLPPASGVRLRSICGLHHHVRRRLCAGLPLEGGVQHALLDRRPGVLRGGPLHGHRRLTFLI